ncbi:glycosyltransferase [Pararhodobacter zhoushanensis]|uniref:Glycosyltransferase n=1 Tax=Pararhodobacter zhoushanensis TaxID=2479545 RepID=A0ABT3H0F6_9RHOB|nr:glycosyltransferase [Pararhodobacter zhoushanensis]MCW1933282.1 glycosyltransferase [Pararhodobacter zhoushanensis]
MASLARQLWTGPLDDPAAPGQAFGARLAGLDYGPALTELRVLAGFGLPVDLRAAQARWPWSIDLGLLIAQIEGDTSPLAAAVRAQNRRFGTLAWTLWTQAQPEAALDTLSDLDPTSGSYADDCTRRAELLILSDLPADPTVDPIPGPRGTQLSLLQTWRREGAAALVRRATLEDAALPAHPPLWAWLIETLTQERDFDAARAALGSFALRCPDHPELTAQRIRLALESEATAQARALLDSLPNPDAPWRWPARRHVQHLRCLADEIAANPLPDYAPLRSGVEAALRLFPRNTMLQTLHLMARELTEDWDSFAHDLVTHPDPRAAAGAFLRLGLPDQALVALDRAPAALPDDAFRLRLRRAEALMRRGQLDAARTALGPVPIAAPLAADHAYWAAEIASAARDFPRAQAALAPAMATSPTRMGLRLTAARVAFLSGDAATAQAHLDRFRALKTAQLGQTPSFDLRDLIVADAVTGHPGPAQAARAFACATPVFVPDTGPPIPLTIAHYWEGPRSPALERSLRAWRTQFAQTVFDAATARAWLADHTDLAPLFDRLTQPATRADLFRVALIAQEGGVFTDLDEYPRAPVAPWLDQAAAVLVIEEGHGTLANNFLAARPGLALFTRLQTRIAQTLHQTDTPYAWWDTGPAQLSYVAHETPTTGLRFLTQAEYDARVSTNLPFAHKRGPGHWR